MARARVFGLWVLGTGLLSGSALGGPRPNTPNTPSARSTSASDALDALMKRFAGLRGFEARFVETKRMKLLSVPLRTEGRLYFSAPGRLLRVVEKPRAARVLVTPDSVTMRTSGQAQRIDLASQPEVRSLVSSMLSLLKGDRAGLEQAYRLKYEREKPEGWTLELSPRSPRLAALIKSMRFDGSGPYLRRITVEEASGDIAVTEVSDADPNRTYSEQERRQLFEAP